MAADSAENKRGFIYILGCFLIWGLFPVYWHPLAGEAIGSDQILAQRIVWSAVFSVLVLLLGGYGRAFAAAAKNRRTVAVFAGTAAMLSVNWLAYLWAVTNGHILDASLGYFITPLVTVLLARIFLREKLLPRQSAAVLIAIAGVVYLTVLGGKLPAVSIILALSFGFYGLLRKQAPLDSVTALTLETLWMLPFAAAYLLWHFTQGTLVFGALDGLDKAVLLGSGVVTTVPLLLFAAGAKRMTLANLGMMQYISPTVQLLIGLLVFREPFDTHRFIGYAVVWLAVAVYLSGSLKAVRRAA